MGNIQSVDVVRREGCLGCDRLLRLTSRSAESVSAGGNLTSEAGVQLTHTYARTHIHTRHVLFFGDSDGEGGE